MTKPDDMDDKKFVEYYNNHMVAYAKIIGSNEYTDDKPMLDQIKKFERDYGERYDEIMNKYRLTT